MILPGERDNLASVRILDVINKTTPYFEKAGIDSPRLTIELLLAHLLKRKRLELYLEFERELEEKTLEALREMVKRRGAGEPLQYVTGVAELPAGTEMVMPGDNVSLVIELITPVAMEKGLRFAIREGGHTVGAGTISEIVT
jgi:hypothetical protein